jgi:hypothetical protein
MRFLLTLLSVMFASTMRGIPFSPFSFHTGQPSISLTCCVVSHAAHLS